VSWELEHTDDFEEWLLGCDQDVQEKVVAMFPLLREHGPQLNRPFADTLEGSRYPNMKEMRPTQTVRVFFAFDPTRTAILLIGGDKAGRPERRWYKQMIRTADKLFERHLKEVAKHGKEHR
jgi:hypothetical protein